MGKLVEIAASEKIEVLNLDESSIYLLEDSIERMKKEIENKKQTTAWSWYKSKDDNQKRNIVETILRMGGI